MRMAERRVAELGVAERQKIILEGGEEHNKETYTWHDLAHHVSFVRRSPSQLPVKAGQPDRFACRVKQRTAVYSEAGWRPRRIASALFCHACAARNAARDVTVAAFCARGAH